MKNIETLDISALSLIAGTQVRTVRDTPTELLYQEVMTEAGTNTMFPPIIVYRDAEGNLWIADGHHRVAASIGAGLTTIVAEVCDGTKTEAIAAAVVANRHNGLPMSKSDRFHAMEMLLETQNYSNPALAELLGVSEATVRRWREQSGSSFDEPETRVGKDGKTYPAKNPRKSPPSAAVSPKSQTPTRPGKVEYISEHADKEIEEAEDSDGEFYPDPPCPNKDFKYFPKTTLKLIPQESPHVLLANLFDHFRKGFVEELVVLAMEKIQENLGKTAVNKIMRELNNRYGK